MPRCKVVDFAICGDVFGIRSITITLIVRVFARHVYPVIMTSITIQRFVSIVEFCGIIITIKRVLFGSDAGILSLTSVPYG